MYKDFLTLLKNLTPGLVRSPKLSPSMDTIFSLSETWPLALWVAFSTHLYVFHQHFLIEAKLSIRLKDKAEKRGSRALKFKVRMRLVNKNIWDLCCIILLKMNIRSKRWSEDGESGIGGLEVTLSRTELQGRGDWSSKSPCQYLGVGGEGRQADKKLETKTETDTHRDSMVREVVAGQPFPHDCSHCHLSISSESILEPSNDEYLWSWPWSISTSIPQFCPFILCKSSYPDPFPFKVFSICSFFQLPEFCLQWNDKKF